MCSWESERRRQGESPGNLPAGQGGAEEEEEEAPLLRPLQSTKPLLADEGRGTGDTAGAKALQGTEKKPQPPGGEEGAAGRVAAVLQPACAPPYCSEAMPPLLQRLLDIGVQILEPLPGFHGDRQRESSSGSDKDRQWRLVGGARTDTPLSFRLSSLIQPGRSIAPAASYHTPVPGADWGGGHGGLCPLPKGSAREFEATPVCSLQPPSVDLQGFSSAGEREQEISKPSALRHPGTRTQYSYRRKTRLTAITAEDTRQVSLQKQIKAHQCGRNEGAERSYTTAVKGNKLMGKCTAL